MSSHDRGTDRPSGARLFGASRIAAAIAEGMLRTDFEQLLQRFKDRVGDERRLANYGLHAAKLPDPNRPNGMLEEDGTIIGPIPDPPNHNIYVFDQFTYAEGRDLRSFAVEALAAAEGLMDGLLAAFERANERVVIARARARR